MNVANDTCTKRVWDNGDMDACGRRAVHKKMCLQHLQERVADLKKSIREHEAELVRMRAELEDCLD